PRGEGALPALAASQVALGLAQELADGPAKLDRAAHCVALPEGQLAGHARRGLDDDAIRRDVEHAPAARAEDHDVAVHAGAELVDHLLVELADPPTGRYGIAREE